MEQVTGTIERITFQNEESGYTVAQLHVKNIKELVTVVGSMPTACAGVTLRCNGNWKDHLVHGIQFEIQQYSIEVPSDIFGIKKYLSSGLIRGIGPVFAEKIVNHFGQDTLNVIDRYPEELLKVRGVGKKRVDKIKSCWNDQKVIRDVMVFLQGHGVSPAYAQKIYRTYAQESITVVKQNPYKLAKDIFGIGFKTADTIAFKMGILKDACIRIEAGIEYALSELSNEGHVCYPLDEFFPFCEALLEVPQEMLHLSIQTLKNAERIQLFDIVFEGNIRTFIWLMPLFLAETGIAKEIKRLKQAPCNLRQVDVSKALDWVQKNLSIELAVQQQQAIATSLVEKIGIITGGPGTGKSTITNAILRIAEKLTDKILLAAPTGRAAKRMSEITGKKAQTIHSLLSFDFKKRAFKHNRENPLECDLIIVDEASMIDTILMNAFLKAIPSHARLLFVGDVNQLPSVGPGNVLKEMIHSKQLPLTTLTEIFRQAQGSRIITNAHKINEGQFPDIRHCPDSDFYFVEAQDPEQIVNEIVTLVTQRLPHKYRFHPSNQIQVLAPMKRGMIGTMHLNAVLQQELNPKEESLMRAGKRFVVGDKVMQIRNNYQKEVFNGDLGKIVAIDFVDQSMLVQFEESEVGYDFAEIDELILAYAVSVHKFQGSEYPCIVIPIHTSHFKLLHRNLLYTAVTRAKEMLVLVGSKQAVGMAVRSDVVKKRYTGLKQALLGY